MIQLIADLIFVTSIVVFVITAYKGYEFSLEYEDNKSGIIIFSIGILYLFVVLSSLLAVLFGVFLSGIHILPVELVKLQKSIYILISSLTAYLVSSKFKKCAILFV